AVGAAVEGRLGGTPGVGGPGRGGQGVDGAAVVDARALVAEAGGGLREVPGEGRGLDLRREVRALDGGAVSGGPDGHGDGEDGRRGGGGGAADARAGAAAGPAAGDAHGITGAQRERLGLIGEGAVQVVHDSSSSRRWPRRCSRMRWARWRRLLTVPSRILRAAAVSATDHPRRWRQTTTERCLGSSSARAARSSGWGSSGATVPGS